MDTPLIEIAEIKVLEKTQAQTILDSFTGFFEEAKGWESKAKAIVITDESQTKEMKVAREARLALRDIRVKAENTRKDLKEKSLREGKAIDGIANVIKALIVPIEDHLEKQEKFAELLTEERKSKVGAERAAELQPYVQDVTFYNLKEMSKEGFAELLLSSKTAFEAQKEAERKAEENRIAEEKAKAEEQERIRIENASLKAEAEVREKAITEERAAAEAEKKALEDAQRKEREAREKAELELKTKAEAEEKARLESIRIEAEKKAEQEKLEKRKAYADFLKENGWTKETAGDFKTEETDAGYVLYKKVGFFSK